MFDWSGIYFFLEVVKVFLDFEMFGFVLMRGLSLERDIIGGKFVFVDIDECVLRVSVVRFDIFSLGFIDFIYDIGFVLCLRSLVVWY